MDNMPAIIAALSPEDRADIIAWAFEATAGAPPARVRSKFIFLPEIAETLGVHKRTVARLRKTDATFPKVVRTSARRKGFSRADFDQWLKSRTVQ
jgi:predicted DNA-binding transcriptional regulator AlpA